MTYTEAMAEVEEILGRFSREEPDVDALAAEVKRATELLTLCRAKLRKAEEDVAQVLNPDKRDK